MSTLLHIEASPMKERSHSTATARAFLDAYRAAHPSDSIETVDLWAVDLPPFDAQMIGAKFAVLRAQNATPEQQQRWSDAVAWSRRFNAADKYLFSVPMWNFGVPYRLKHFIDVITLPDENWSWSRAEGYRSLLSNKKAMLVYASAGGYGLTADDAMPDFQKPYLRHWLRFIGVDDVRELNVAPTLTDPESLQATKKRADVEARAAAADF